ncbi:MAG TPA: hypothetical protein VGM68_11635 [Rhizomicrobium sp.]|jgi:hypothetical protein
MRKFLLAALLLVSACGPNAADKAEKKEDADNKPGVALSAEEIKSLGIATTAARASSFRHQVAGYGTVAAIDAIAQTDADTRTAAALATQSAAAAARAQSLGNGDEAAVSREIVEAAQSKAAGDQAALLLARRKAQAVFGVNAPFRDANSRAALIERLANGKSVLVRVTFPLGSLRNRTPTSLSIARLGDGARIWTTSKIWQAPADPALPGVGFYAVIDGSDLAQNEHVTALVFDGAAQTGVLVPAAALVMGDGANWVYLQNGDDHFVRAPIATDKPTGDDYFVPDGNGIAAGQKLVTAGAGLLLSREANPSTEAGE